MIPVMYSREDVQRRLHGVAAMYHNEVYYVGTRDVYLNNGIKCLGIDEVFLFPFTYRADEVIDAAKAKKVKYTDPDVLIKGLFPGYVNLGESLVYITRNPSRNVQLGTHYNNVCVKLATNGKSYPLSPKSFYHGQVKDAFKKIYPTCPEAFERIKCSKFSDGVAFGNDYAFCRIDREIVRLDVRGMGVAINVGNNDTFTPLNKKVFSILEEEVEPFNIKLA